MIVRSSILYYISGSWIILLWLGGLTCCIGGLMGMFQNDLKKIIAYSTISQLGYMVMSSGIFNNGGAIFHLVNHAFFKSLLFLSAGSILHSGTKEEQDIRKMGQLINKLRVSYICILTGSMSLMALRFMTGYYSKEVILEGILGDYNNINIYWLGLIGAFITSFYSTKLIFYVFFGKNNNRKICYTSSKESEFIMLIPLCILLIFALVLGYLIKDQLIGLGTDYWLHSIFNNGHINTIESEYIGGRKWLGLIFSLSGCVTCLIMINRGLGIVGTIDRWWSILINSLVIGMINGWSRMLGKGIDKGHLEYIGGNGIGGLVGFCYIRIHNGIQNGNILHYINYILLLGLLYLGM